MEEKYYLTPNEILEHEFKIDARGYRMPEVDKFLDKVIRDYTEFLRTIKSLEQENKNLRDDNHKLQEEYRKIKTLLETANASNNTNASGVNTDVLRRLSNLEKIVYGK